MATSTNKVRANVCISATTTKKKNRDRANTANPPVSGRQNNPVRMKPRERRTDTIVQFTQIYIFYLETLHTLVLETDISVLIHLQ